MQNILVFKCIQMFYMHLIAGKALMHPLPILEVSAMGRRRATTHGHLRRRAEGRWLSLAPILAMIVQVIAG